MPSGGSPFWGVSLAKRVRRLERVIQPNLADQQRAYLEQWLNSTTPEYAEHRAALIEALLSDYPRYTFTATPPGSDAPMTYMVSWYQRERLAPVVIRLYSWIFDALS